METYELNIWTSNSTTVEVEANSEEEAKRKVIENWNEYAANMDYCDGYGVECAEVPPHSEASVTSIAKHALRVNTWRSDTGGDEPVHAHLYDAELIAQGLRENHGIDVDISTRGKRFRLLEMFGDCYAEHEGEAYCDALCDLAQDIADERGAQSNED